jgi:hypothetical protein
VSGCRPRPTHHDGQLAWVNPAVETKTVSVVCTGGPWLMVMTAETCVGPRAYVGLASSYHEKTTDNFQRLQDGEWSAQLQATPPADIRWMTDLVVHRDAGPSRTGWRSWQPPGSAQK